MKYKVGDKVIWLHEDGGRWDHGKIYIIKSVLEGILIRVSTKNLGEIYSFSIDSFNRNFKLIKNNKLPLWF